MSVPTQTDIQAPPPVAPSPAFPRWLIPAAAWTASIGVLVVAAIVRAHHLGILRHRDYDEGVYWQTLRAMQDGHPLFSSIFSSQPPFFALSEYPFFSFFGADIQAARLGIVVISIAGLVGMLFIGRALAGWPGQLAAVVLLTFNALAVDSSQTLQADGPSIAFATLSVGLIALWWRNPSGRKGAILASSSLVVLVFALSTKLLAVGAIAPIAILFGARFFQVWKKPSGERLSQFWPMIIAVGAGIIAVLAIYLPFVGSFHDLYTQVVTFHNDAAAASINFPQAIRPAIRDILWGIAPLVFLGLFAALWQRNFLVIAMIGWLAATAMALHQIHPLFRHHLIALVPPVIAIGVAAFAVKPGSTWWLKRTATALTIIVASILVIGTVHRSTGQIREAFSKEKPDHTKIAIAADISKAVKKDQKVVTDMQFIAGLADRDVPPNLVDSSSVRINTKYLTSAQLIAASAKPDVRAVLYYGGQFQGKASEDFRTWVKQHFVLVRDYGHDKQLWVKR